MRLLNACILILALLAFVSCSENKKYIIPEKKMVPLLVDIHLADEIGTSKYELDPEMELDSAGLYGWVFSKHGVTRAEFDSSMLYYAGKPDILNRIYAKVIAGLSKMEAELAKAEQEESDKTVVYEDKTIYRLPAVGSRIKIPFDVPLTGPGDYILKAKIMIHRTDQSVNPHITAYYWYDNGTPEGARDYFKPVSLKKTGRTDMYSVSKRLTNPKYTSLKGYILDHDNADTNFVKHAVVMEISVLK
jgi:hypothetical protein